MFRALVFAFLMFFPFQALASAKTVHVVVALCDNIHQRIYPVPLQLGRGNKPETNLYWGAMYGVKTYFKNSKDWILITEEKDISPEILRRVVFKHKKSDTYMVADAYLGKEIKKAISDYVSYLAGKNEGSLNIFYKEKKQSINTGGASDMLVYIGHNGLMDFSLEEIPKSDFTYKKEAIILACYSKSYFQEYIDNLGVSSVLWTRSKMAPEAYVLKAAIEAWVDDLDVKEAAAESYAKYQKISKKLALRIFSDN